MSEIDSALQELHVAILDSQNFTRAVLSGRRRNMEVAHERIDIRPVEIKKIIMAQMTYSDGRAMTTKNFLPNELPFIDLAQSGYSNILVETTTETLTLRFSKKGEPLFARGKSDSKQNLAHDRKKERLLDSNDAFLKEVGISDKSGVIKPSMMYKYMQVEEFLRLLIPTLNEAISAGHIHEPTTEKPLTVVDLGCGHAYLTFAAHQYLQAHQIPVKVIGIDIRETSRVRNNQIAKKLGIDTSIEFLAEEISSASVVGADIAIALHACDTATDDAIAWAVNHNVPLTLFAPCCQHDIQSQMKVAPEPWAMVTRHGIMRERLGDLITDSLRIQLMKLHGYRVEAIEFVGGVHTPRNLMIRGVKTGAQSSAADEAQYLSMIELWGVKPVLAGLLNR
jgi:SAM-dependent methyltransferase